MESTSRQIQKVTIVSHVDGRDSTLEGRIGIFVVNNNITIIALNTTDDESENKSNYVFKDDAIMHFYFHKDTSPAFIKNIARDMRNVLHGDNELNAVITKLKTASESFKTYVKNEIGNGKLSDDLYVLDFGTGVYILNEVIVCHGVLNNKV